MKKIIYISITMVIILGGCKKSTLELNNPNQITTATYWKTSADVLSGLAATYNSFVTEAQTGLYTVRGVELMNGRGDDFFIRNDVSDLYTLSTFTNTASNGVASGYWNTCYQGIFSANQVITYAPAIQMDATTKAQEIAEAKFLRGLFYFNLEINFQNVPLRLTIPKTQKDYYIAKSPATAVWAQIVQDFTEAAAALPASYPAQWVGRATSGAAYAYLAKAYLYQGNYAAAEAAAGNIMKGQYSLTANFSDNFDATHENNSESVFEIQLSDVGGTNPWTTGSGENLGTTVAQEFAPSQIGGWFEICPTDTLLSAFMKEKMPSGNYDLRLPATLVWQGETSALGGNTTFYQQPIANFFPGDFSSYHSRLKKYQNFNQANELVGSNNTQYSSSNNERVMRYAEVLMIHAEAVTMQGRPQDAYADVNAIRTRAGLGTLPAGYSQTQMMTEIMHQREIEFAREGDRFYDLVRWNLIQQALTNSDKVGKQYYAAKFNYFPIPQSELDNNPLMVQNTAWGN